MVHALKEFWRVLVPKGVLIDLRPLHTSPPIEIVAGGEVLIAGYVDESRGVPNDTAANNSMAQAVQADWFVCEKEEAFDFATYWDTPDELKAYAEEWWSNSRLPEEALEEARRLASSNSAVARVRVRYETLISRYRKHF